MSIFGWLILGTLLVLWGAFVVADYLTMRDARRRAQHLPECDPSNCDIDGDEWMARQRAQTTTLTMIGNPYTAGLRVGDFIRVPLPRDWTSNTVAHFDVGGPAVITAIDGSTVTYSFGRWIVFKYRVRAWGACIAYHWRRQWLYVVVPMLTIALIMLLLSLTGGATWDGSTS